MSRYNRVSFLGLFVLLGVAWLCSAQRRNLNWRAIGWGVGLQLFIGLFAFVVPVGRTVFLWLNVAVVTVLSYANEGTKFVFGPLATAKGPNDFILAFQALSTIIFFSALMALLYHVRLMPLLVRRFARVFTRRLRLSGAESLSVASNTFVGVEAAFVRRPHLRDLTASEYCTVLATGMATVSSHVLARYVGFLSPEFPTIAGHLISVTLIAIPAAVGMAKIILPEDGQPLTLGRDVAPHDDRDSSLFGAIVRGAQEGLQVILGIVAVLIAVVGLVHLANGLLG